MPLTKCHTIGGSDDLITRLRGAVAIIFIWGLGEFVGPFSPILLVVSAMLAPWYVSAAFAAVMIYPFLVPEASLYSPAFCRFTLSMAGWFKGGSSIWVADDVLAKLPEDRLKKGGFMVCYHPHGVIPFGFSLNGAVRARAKQPDALPPWLHFDASVSGVQAPVLFKVPLLRWILLGLGCCVPATKAGVRRLLRTRTTFGIIPGGSEEVAIHENGKENIYLRERAGFIKYALQHGYTLLVAFTFGESDLYHSSSLVRPLNLWLVKRFGFVLPIFAGFPLCPLLPRTDVPLHSVLGAALELPRIDDPSKEDVERWHAAYMRALEQLFDEHKAQFGYGDRKLNFF